MDRSILALAVCGACDSAIPWEVAQQCECGSEIAALLWIDLEFSTGVRIASRVELVGPWSSDDAARVRRAMFRVIASSENA